MIILLLIAVLQHPVGNASAPGLGGGAVAGWDRIGIYIYIYIYIYIHYNYYYYDVCVCIHSLQGFRLGV